MKYKKYNCHYLALIFLHFSTSLMCQTSSCRLRSARWRQLFISVQEWSRRAAYIYELLGNTDFLGTPIFKDNARSGEEKSVQWGHLTLCGRKLLCRAPPRVHCAPQGAIFEEIFLWWVFWVTWGANGSRVTSTGHHLQTIFNSCRISTDFASENCAIAQSCSQLGCHI